MPLTNGTDEQWSMDRRTLLKRTGVAGIGLAGTASAIDRTAAQTSCGEQSFMVAYEELRPKRADWDYNDFTHEVRVAFNEPNDQAKLTVSPIAALAGLKSDLEIHLPKSLIHSNASYRVERRDIPTQTVTKVQEGHVSRGTSLNTRLVNTVGDAVTSGSADSCPMTRHELTLTVDFERSFPSETACPWPLPTKDEFGTHGSELFFTPALRRLDTGKRVMPGDDRFLLLPSPQDESSWARPKEGVHIADAYESVSRTEQSSVPSFDRKDWFRREYANEKFVYNC
ncbi:hypothetical protein [Halocatena halophila]|uniref:hypothetical protein n=1 Tax=Halocatena halophila TaxID=2814576 RepID=UPI002ED17E02